MEAPPQLGAGLLLVALRPQQRRQRIAVADLAGHRQVNEQGHVFAQGELDLHALIFKAGRAETG